MVRELQASSNAGVLSNAPQIQIGKRTKPGGLLTYISHGAKSHEKTRINKAAVSSYFLTPRPVCALSPVPIPSS